MHVKCHHCASCQTSHVCLMLTHLTQYCHQKRFMLINNILTYCLSTDMKLQACKIPGLKNGVRRTWIGFRKHTLSSPALFLKRYILGGLCSWTNNNTFHFVAYIESIFIKHLKKLFNYRCEHLQIYTGWNRKIVEMVKQHNFPLHKMFNI